MPLQGHKGFVMTADGQRSHSSTACQSEMAAASPNAASTSALAVVGKGDLHATLHPDNREGIWQVCVPVQHLLDPLRTCWLCLNILKCCIKGKPQTMLFYAAGNFSTCCLSL